MKATVKTFIVSMTFGLVGALPPTLALAGQSEMPSVATTPSAAPGNPQREAETYLKQARQAIKDQKFELARDLIGKAEAMKVVETIKKEAAKAKVEEPKAPK